MPLYAASLALIPDGPAKTNGIAVGQQAAAGILSFRANDGRDAVAAVTYPAVAPGVWIAYTAGLPSRAGAVRSGTCGRLSLNSPSTVQGRRAARSVERRLGLATYNETKSLGAATGSTRTPEQTDLARIHGSDQPMLLWNRIWRGISVSQRT